MQGITYSVSMKNTIKVEGKEYEPKLDKNGEIVFKEVGVIEPEVPEVAEYTTFTVRDSGTLGIKNLSDDLKVTELYIDGVTQDLPNTNLYTEYNVLENQQVKIKGHFNLNNKSHILLDNIVLQNDLTSCSNMFYSCEFAEAPVIPECVTDCEMMFCRCGTFTKAPSIPNNVTNCKTMFYYCTDLVEASIIPSTVKNCTGMFVGCEKLSILPQENIDLMNNPPDGMVYEKCYIGCPLVADIVLQTWGGNVVPVYEYTTFTIEENGTLKIANIYENSITEFYINDIEMSLPTGKYCYETTNLYAISGQKIKIKGSFSLFNTQIKINNIILQSDLTDCSNMFSGCTELTKAPIIPLSVTNCYSMFENCYSLTEAPEIPYGVENCYNMFSDCRFTTPPTIPDSVTNCCSMFANCYNLIEAPEIPYGVEYCDYMFYGCSFTTPPTIPDSVTNCAYMFANCSIDMAPEIPYSVINCSYMFSNCSNIYEAPTIPDGVSYCSYMFEYCTNLTTAPIIPQNASDCSYMFYGCSSLTNITYENSYLMDSFSGNHEGCFRDCTNICEPISYWDMPDDWK